MRTDVGDIQQIVSAPGLYPLGKLSEATKDLAIGLCPELRQQLGLKWVLDKSRELQGAGYELSLFIKEWAVRVGLVEELNFNEACLDQQDPPMHVPYSAKFLSCQGFQAGATVLTKCELEAIVRCEITVQNTGSESWNQGYRPISLGVLNGNPPTDDNRAGNGPIRVDSCDGDSFTAGEVDNVDRAWLFRDDQIHPGMTKTFVFGLRMPKEPGPYPVTFQMVMDGPGIAAIPSNDGWFAGEVLRATFHVVDPPNFTRDRAN